MMRQYPRRRWNADQYLSDNTIFLFSYNWHLLSEPAQIAAGQQKCHRKGIRKVGPRRLKEIKLTEPLSEKTRPASITDIIGQEQGLKALRAALCGPNPQHVIIYGPPGVGKTAAARVILEEAKQMLISPFRRESKFVEVDATILRFDERGIADPLIGSIHDPIYQGANCIRCNRYPQPKPRVP